jgi:hypothetical protein
MAEVAPPAGRNPWCGWHSSSNFNFSKSESFWGAEFGKSAVKVFRRRKRRKQRRKEEKREEKRRREEKTTKSGQSSAET